MAMPQALRRFTVDDVEALPDDGNRYEVLHGVLLVTPAPGIPHQTVATKLAAILSAFLDPEPEVRVWAPGVVRVQPDIQLEPDILVGRMPTNMRWELVGDRWLAVEVSGTGSRVYDREYKRDGYLEVGLAEVWLVDLESRQVLVSRVGSAKDVPHQSAVIWRSPGGRELRIDIPALFRGVPKGE
jgi:Uma2 family endonuclease